MIATIFEFMEERETIRQARESGRPFPWTDDPVLQTWRFTNVCREHDAVSIWIQQNITDKYLDHPQLWILLALARQINWPQSLQVALDALSLDILGGEITHGGLHGVRLALDSYQAAGNKVYTGSYMIHSDCNPATASKWETKNEYIVEHVVGQLLWQKPPLRSIEAFTRWLSQFDAWGMFMSYETACDLRWAPGWLDTAPDLYTWASPGPGAYRGLNRVHGRPIKPNVSEGQAIREMRALLAQAQRYAWHVEWSRPFEMRDIEHVTCEWDKHQRVVHGQGKPRMKFRPKDEPKTAVRSRVSADDWLVL